MNLRGNTEGRCRASFAKVFKDTVFKAEGRVWVKTLVLGRRVAFWRSAETAVQGIVISKDAWSFPES